jgi:hypothetical protein
LAGEFRARAVDEVRETDLEVTRARGVAGASQIIDYIFFVIYGLSALRFLLALLAARSSAGFVRFIVAVTDPLYRVSRHRLQSQH